MTTRALAEEAQIRQLIDGVTRALHAKDVDALMAHYTEDILSYDLAPPLAHEGAAVNRRGWTEWFPTFDGPVGYEVRDLRITIRDDLAFSTSLNRISGTRTDGGHTDVWVRATACYRKVDGAWKVAHEHLSVPFYMDGSFRAAVDLRP